MGIKKRGQKKTLLQKKKTERDVHAPQDTNPPAEEYLRKFTQKMCQLKTDRPVILPLLKKLYSTPKTETDLYDVSVESNGKTGKTETTLSSGLPGYWASSYAEVP